MKTEDNHNDGTEAEIPLTPVEESQIQQTQSEQQTDTKYQELPLHKTPHFYHNLRNTLVFCYMFFLAGVAITITGPTLPQLARNINTTLDDMGWIFTGKAITSIIFNAAGGRIMDHFKDSTEEKKLRVNKLMLLCSPLAIATSMFVIPFTPWYWLMIGINAVTEMGTSMAGIVASTLMVWIWKDRVNGPVQFLHFSFGAGGVISPLIVSACDAIVTAYQGPGDVIAVVDGRTVYNKYVHVAAAYVVSGVLCLTSIPLVLFVLKSNKKEVTVEPVQEIEMLEIDKSEGEDAEQTETKVSEHISPVDTKLKRKRFIVSILIGLALLNYVGAELGYGAVLYSYVVEMTGLASDTEGSMLTSAFWLSFTIGRLLGVPASVVLSPKNMILLDIAGGMLSVTAILIFKTNMIALWICTIAFGLSLASQYPTTIALPASHMGLEVTGTMTATMIIFASFGGMIIPVVMTSAIKWIGSAAFVYVLFGTSLIASVLYLVIIFGFKKEENSTKDSK